MKLNKRAALSISIEAIVIIVIAFVVLGLGLTLTQTIFKGGTEKIPGIIDIGDIGKEPTAEDPLTIDSTINVKRGDSRQINLGFYNREVSTATNVTIELINCISVATGEQVIENEPTVTSIPQNVGPSEGAAFMIFVNEKGLSPGNYLCNAVAKGYVEITEKTFATKQVTLRVTS